MGKVTFPPADVRVPSVECNAHLVKTEHGWHIEFVFDNGATLREDSNLFETVEEANTALQAWLLQNGCSWKSKQ